MMQLLMLLSKMKHHGDIQTHVQKKYLWLSQFKASFSSEYIHLYMSLQSLFHLLRNRVQEWQHDPIKTYKMQLVCELVLWDERLCSNFRFLLLELCMIHQGLALVQASDMLRNDPIIQVKDGPIYSLSFQKPNTCIH